MCAKESEVIFFIFTRVHVELSWHICFHVDLLKLGHFILCTTPRPWLVLWD